MMSVRTAGWIALGFALIVATVGMGGRALAPEMANEDCFALDGLEPGIRLYCLGNSDAGGWCAGLAEDIDSRDPALLCAWPALLLQKASFAAVAVGSASVAGLLGVPALLALSSPSRPPSAPSTRRKTPAKPVEQRPEPEPEAHKPSGASEIEESVPAESPPGALSESAPNSILVSESTTTPGRLPSPFTVEPSRTFAERLEKATPATFGIRAVAFVIDLLAIIVLAFVIILPIQAVAGQEQQQNDALGGVYILIMAATFIGYEWISGLFGATPGMRLFSLRIIRVDGTRIDGTAAFLRAIVLFLGGLILVGPFSGLWHKEGRAFHDLASGTGVVRL